MMAKRLGPDTYDYISTPGNSEKIEISKKFSIFLSSFKFLARGFPYLIFKNWNGPDYGP